jgi:hypothetical protein
MFIMFVFLSCSDHRQVTHCATTGYAPVSVFRRLFNASSICFCRKSNRRFALWVGMFLSWSALRPTAFLASLAHFLWVTGLGSTATASTVYRHRCLDDEIVLDVSVTGRTFHVSHFTYVYDNSCGIL